MNLSQLACHLQIRKRNIPFKRKEQLLLVQVRPKRHPSLPVPIRQLKYVAVLVRLNRHPR